MIVNTCYFSAGDGVSYPTRTIDLDSDGLLADRQRWMEEGEMDSNPGQWAKKDNSYILLVCGVLELSLFLCVIKLPI